MKSKAKDFLGKYKTLVGEYLENLKMRLKAHEVRLWCRIFTEGERQLPVIIFLNSLN